MFNTIPKLNLLANRNNTSKLITKLKLLVTDFIQLVLHTTERITGIMTRKILFSLNIGGYSAIFFERLKRGPLSKSVAFVSF